jgi:isoleucyl-tRNA synthetase
MLQLWNTYGFFVRYASLPDRVPGSQTDLDRWVLSRLSATVEQVIERLDDYDTTSAGRAVSGFVEDLSNWYVRRSRRRFWDGDQAALDTLEECLVTVAKLLAPLVPFVSDAIYENLDGSEPSVHLCDYPVPGPRDVELEQDMAVAREAIELGRAARAQAKLKVRQPLSEAVVVAAGRERASIERFAELLLEDLNVKAVRFVSEAEELGRFELKPNYRVLGPRFGKRMPAVADAVAALDAQRVASVLRAGGSVGISIDGSEHPLGADDVQLVLQPLEGYRVERAGTHAVALSLALTPELRREGLAREVVHAVQSARKSAGLNVEDRIALMLGGDGELLDAVRAHEAYVAGETLALSVAYDGADGDGDAVSIDGHEFVIRVERSSAQ